MANLRYKALLCLTLLCVFCFPRIASSQESSCGTPDASLAKHRAILDNLPESGPLSSPWKIPIWFYKLRSATGSTNHQNFDPESAIGPLNQYFNGLFEYTICGITIIDDDRFLDMNINSSSNDFSDLQVLVSGLNQPSSNGCVRVFLSNTVIKAVNPTAYIGGVAYDRIDNGTQACIIIATESFENWAHEFGHYFGLLHTFQGGFDFQYVHDFQHPVTINGNSVTCLQDGDGICDTPADLESCSYSNCIPDCVVHAVDPLETPYAPDPTLLMSYYDGCRNKFSADQQLVMAQFYSLTDYYKPLREASSECLVSKYGKIERSCGIAGNETVTPMKGVAVEVRSNTLVCSGLNNLTNLQGRYLTANCTFSPTDNQRKVLPDKSNGDELNGVTTADLLVLQNHILYSTPWDNPFQLIAADANKSGSITTFDMLTIRRVILDPISNDFGAGSWRYVPGLCLGTAAFYNQFYADVDPLTLGNQFNPFVVTFSDPLNGFTRYYNSATSNIPNNDSWMDFVNLDVTAASARNEKAWSFTAVKVGDLNCSANINNVQTPSNPDNSFTTIAHSPIAANQIFYLQVKASGSTSIGGWQLGVNFDQNYLQM